MPTVGKSPRLKALEKLSSSMPVQNQQMAQGQQAARTMQMQQQLAGAPAGTTARAAQQVGAQQAQQAGQIATQAAQREQTQQALVGQLGLQERGRELRGAQAQEQMAAQREQFEGQEKLAGMREDLKQQLFDKDMQFRKDELGRTQFNESQLRDWALTKAQNQEQYRDYAQLAEQVGQRKLALIDQAYKVFAQAAQQEYARAKQVGDQESQLRISKMVSAAEDAAERERARQRSRAASWQAGGQLLGAGLGAAIGWAAAPATGGASLILGGAGLGSALGGGLGSLGFSQS